MCHFLPWILRFTITIVLIISARWVDVFFSCHLENWFVIPIHQQLALTLDIDAWMSERSGWNMFTPYRWIVWENRIFTSRKQSIIIWWRDLISVYNLRERREYLFSSCLSRSRTRCPNDHLAFSEDISWKAQVCLSSHSIISLDTSLHIQVVETRHDEMEMSTIVEMRKWLYRAYHYHCCDIPRVAVQSFDNVGRIIYSSIVLSHSNRRMYTHMYIYAHPDNI